MPIGNCGGRAQHQTAPHLASAAEQDWTSARLQNVRLKGDGALSVVAPCAHNSACSTPRPGCRVAASCEQVVGGCRANARPKGWTRGLSAESTCWRWCTAKATRSLHTQQNWLSRCHLHPGGFWPKQVPAIEVSAAAHVAALELLTWPGQQLGNMHSKFGAVSCHPPQHI